MSDHFKGKDALGHVAEKQALGILTSKEVHGLELPGSKHALLDSARNTFATLLILYAILTPLNIDPFPIMAMASVGLTVWLAGRSAWLSWVRLERLHRILAQEKWEIEHNRPQEREELRVLYGAKGFEGQLLEEVIDVLMADEGRLLKVMVQEEMGITLENIEHPLKQGLYSFFGALISAILMLSFLSIPYVPLVAGLVAISVLSGWAAQQVDNRIIPASVWSTAIAVVSVGLTYYVTQYFYGR